MPIQTQGCLSRFCEGERVLVQMDSCICNASIRSNTEADGNHGEEDSLQFCVLDTERSLC